MSELSSIAEAIRNYKLNAEGGYEAWAKVPCSNDYRMYVPSYAIVSKVLSMLALINSL